MLFTRIVFFGTVVYAQSNRFTQRSFIFVLFQQFLQNFQPNTFVDTDFFQKVCVDGGIFRRDEIQQVDHTGTDDLHFVNFAVVFLVDVHGGDTQILQFDRAGFADDFAFVSEHFTRGGVDDRAGQTVSCQAIRNA